MGIHVHVKGKPDMCRCCAIVDRLNELWDRTHNSVLSVNGIYADGNGNVLIPGIQDISDLRQQVADDRQYLEAVAEDLVTNYATKSALQGLSESASATQTQLTNLANEVHSSYTTKDWIWDTSAGADNGLVHRTQNETIYGVKAIEDGLNFKGSWQNPARPVVADALTWDNETSNAANVHGIVNDTTANRPATITQGYIETFVMSPNRIIKRITGFDANGNPCLWTNRLAFGVWSGWRKFTGVND